MPTPDIIKRAPGESEVVVSSALLEVSKDYKPRTRFSDPFDYLHLLLCRFDSPTCCIPPDSRALLSNPSSNHVCSSVIVGEIDIIS